MLPLHLRGQTLLELILAMGIMSAMLTIIVPFLGTRGEQTPQIQMRGGAVRAATEGIEGARAIRDGGWASLSPGAHGLTLINNQWTFQGTSDTSTGLVRTVTVVDRSASVREVQSTVVEPLPNGRTRNVTLSTLLTNWREGSGQLSGDWSRPQVIGTIDVGAGNQATALAVRDRIVYVATKASDRSKSDFSIIDATVSQAPVVRSTLNTGPGLNAVAVSGNYAYVANDDEQPQLQIISIANPLAPSVVGSLQLSSDGEGLSVAVQGTTVYVGIEKNSGPEFFVVDATTSSAPVLRGSLEIGDDVRDIFFVSNRALLATPRDTAELTVVEVTTSTQPQIRASFNVLGDSEQGTGVYHQSQNQRIYLTRTIGGNHATHHELVIFDGTSLDTPVLLGSKNFSNDLNAVVGVDQLIFLASSNSNQEFQVYDGTNPGNPSAYANLNLSQVATDIAFEQNLIYLTLRSNDGLQIITSQ